jgi:hypothetical protein
LGRFLDVFPSFWASHTGYFLGERLKQFSPRVEILPSYIPVRVAEKILFVAESVQVFENQKVNLTRKGRDLLAQHAAPGQVSVPFGGPKQAWSG